MHRITRSAAGLLAGATALALAVPTAAVAQDATPTDAAASWLAGQLADGDHLESEFEGTTFVNYGPTADVALGLLSTGTEPGTLQAVMEFLTTAESVDGYVHGGSSDTYAGATGKLGYLVSASGGDPRAVGGEDLVATLESLEADTGRYSDDSEFGDFSNVLGQSFGLLFLDAADGTDPSADAVQFLVDAQCDDGGFPQAFGAVPCESSVDATGLALQALAAVDATASVRDDAVAWLQGEQATNGSWGDNVNSTAYAGMGLTANGADAADARQFLLDVQNDDGGLPISPDGDSDPIATAQGLPLLGETTLAATPPTPTLRLAGEDRRLTAIEVSRADWADGAAATVVLTRDDLFADALSGTPLAVEAEGPLLTTSPTGLDDEVLAEIQRVLPEGGEVLVLGGPDALPASVDADLTDAGFAPRRVFGETRYDTSVAIAEELGDPELQLLTTGLDFADALTAGTAAGAQGGAVLLTEGETAWPAVTTYLDANDGRRVAIGGPAAAAYPEAEAMVGETRDDTAVMVAREFFDAPSQVGVARRDLFADALAGGALMARLGGPLVLTDPVALPDVTGTYLCDVADGLRRATVFGGPVAVDDGVVGTVRDRVTGVGC